MLGSTCCAAGLSGEGPCCADTGDIANARAMPPAATIGLIIELSSWLSRLNAND
jgi:hypothetical protein